MRTHFKNELGNDIDIQIETVAATEAVAGVCVTITGPHSQSENTLTRMEAERLAEMLTRFLA